MKLWGLIVWNQRFRKYYFSRAYVKVKCYWVFCVDKKIFFSCVYIKERYYWVFCNNKKIFFSGVYIKEKYYWVFCINKIFFFFEYNIRMLEITIDNCYKCDLETINDPNNSQYIWINRIDLEIETKCNWQVMSN